MYVLAQSFCDLTILSNVSKFHGMPPCGPLLTDYTKYLAE